MSLCALGIFGKGRRSRRTVSFLVNHHATVLPIVLCWYGKFSVTRSATSFCVFCLFRDVFNLTEKVTKGEEQRKEIFDLLVYSRMAIKAKAKRDQSEGEARSFASSPTWVAGSKTLTWSIFSCFPGTFKTRKQDRKSNRHDRTWHPHELLAMQMVVLAAMPNYRLAGNLCSNDIRKKSAFFLNFSKFLKVSSFFTSHPKIPAPGISRRCGGICL